MAFPGHFTKMDVVLDKLYRNYHFQDVDYQDVVSWVGEAIALFGIAPSLVEKTEVVSIEDYRGELPCDFYEMHTGGVRDYDTKNTMVPKSDIYFHSSDKYNPLYGYAVSNWTYHMNDNFIFTHFEEGAVEITYRAFKTDNDGRPMIPNNETFILAVVGYVAENLAWHDFMTKKMDRLRYEYVKQKATRAQIDAESEARIPTRDEQEAFKNMWVRLLPPFHPHDYGDANLIEPRRPKNNS